MDANPRSIAQIFKARVRFCVPVFQRHYVWSQEKQWEPLWEDIISKATDRIEGRQKYYPHYMGAIVYESKDPFSTTRVQICNVIDGQQRLTTLQIFLAALRDAATAMGFDKIAKNTEQYLFNDDPDMMEDPEVEIFKVWPTRFDRPIYSDMLSLRSLEGVRKKYWKHFPAGMKRLRRDKTRDIPPLLKAYMYFYERIKEYVEKGELGEENLTAEERLDFIYRAFLEDFRIVAIELGEGDDPQVIFETLNDRGTPLLASDLIRNFIFYRAENENTDPVKLYEENWSTFETPFWSEEARQGRLRRPRLEFFMQHFLGAKTGHEVNLIKVFQEYKTFIQTRKSYNGVEEELADIKRYSPLYRTLVQPKGEGYFVRFAEGLKPWDVSTAFPLIMQIMASDLEEQEKRGMMEDILSYIVRRAICQKTPKNYNKLFIQIVRHLNKVGVNPAGLRGYLLAQKSETTVWPSDGEFEAAWLNRPAYIYLSSGRINYVLKEIERKQRGKFAEDIEIKSSLCVEHVLPQAWYENWPLETGEKVTKTMGLQATQKVYDYVELTYMGLDDEGEKTVEDRINKRNRLLQTFGNLTLLTTQLNSKNSHGPFDAKRKAILEHSALALNRYFQNVDEWNETKIEERGKLLFNVAKDVWAHPGKEAAEVEAA